MAGTKLSSSGITYPNLTTDNTKLPSRYLGSGSGAEHVISSLPNSQVINITVYNLQMSTTNALYLRVGSGGTYSAAAGNYTYSNLFNSGSTLTLSSGKSTTSNGLVIVPSGYTSIASYSGIITLSRSTSSGNYWTAIWDLSTYTSIRHINGVGTINNSVGGTMDTIRFFPTTGTITSMATTAYCST